MTDTNTSTLPAPELQKKPYWVTIILCSLFGYYVYGPLQSDIFLTFVFFFFFYLAYQIKCITFQKPSFWQWRLVKIGLWLTTIAIVGTNHYNIRITQKNQANQLVQNIEAFRQAHSRYPDKQEGETLVRELFSPADRVYYAPPENSSYPNIFYKDPNFIFTTCFYLHEEKTWRCD